MVRSFKNVFVFLCTLSGFFVFASAPEVSSHFEIHGHRGARAARPENTLAGFHYALLSGVTALEMDLGVTKDNVLVVNHDLFVDTTLCYSSDPHLRSLVKPLVNSLTLKQIKTYDCGSIRNPEFTQQLLVPNQKIPSFAEVMIFLRKSPLAQARKVKINIETKIEAEKPKSTVGPEKFVELIAAEIIERDFDPTRVIVQSFDFRTITLVKRKWPSIKTSALINSDYNTEELSKLFAETRADYVSPNGNNCDSSLVKNAHALGKKVLVWTINNPFHWRRFVKLGVDGIITDDPAPLVKFLFSKR